MVFKDNPGVPPLVDVARPATLTFVQTASATPTKWRRDLTDKRDKPETVPGSDNNGSGCEPSIDPSPVTVRTDFLDRAGKDHYLTEEDFTAALQKLFHKSGMASDELANSIFIRHETMERWLQGDSSPAPPSRQKILTSLAGKLDAACPEPA